MSDRIKNETAFGAMLKSRRYDPSTTERCMALVISLPKHNFMRKGSVRANSTCRRDSRV
jgi:hypothetical protein